MSKIWFREAILSKKPYSLGGWSKNKPAGTRRRLAVASRPNNWSRRKKYLSSGQALRALANVTTDLETRRKARADSEYFFRKLKK